MITELIYLGRDNVNQLTVTDMDEQPVDFSGVTRMVMSFQGSDIIIDSALHPEMIEWNSGGVVTLSLGAAPIKPSKYFATLTTFDPQHDDGQVVFHSAEGRVQLWFVAEGASGNDESALDELADQVAENTTDIEELANMISGHEQRIAELETTSAEHEIDITALQSDDVALDERLDTAESDIDALQLAATNEATTRGNADTALAGRLDDLEAGSTAHKAAHAAMGVARKARRCNPIIKLKPMNQINAAASTSTAAWGIKLRVPCDFYGIRLHFFNQHANTPNWQAVIAATETAATDTAANLSQPIVAGAAVTSLDSTSTIYGWRTVTFSGSTPGVHSAGGTTYVPNILSSDIIPIMSVARTDGGTGRLLMIRASSPGAATQGYTFGSINAAMRTPTAANRGLIYQTWFTGSGGHVTSPGANNVSALDTSGTPVVAIELLTHARGSTILVAGDSLTANDSLVADTWSNWGLRAAMDLSTDLNPVGIINCGCSGQNSATFYAAGIQQLNLFKPSAAFYPIWTPNDYASPADANTVRYRISGALSRAAQFIDAAELVGTRVILWTGLPNKAATGLNTAAKDAVRVAANTLLKTYPNIIVADFDAVMSDGASPAGFTPAYSFGDEIHMSEAGVEAIAVTPARNAAAIALGL